MERFFTKLEMRFKGIESEMEKTTKQISILRRNKQEQTETFRQWEEKYLKLSGMLDAFHEFEFLVEQYGTEKMKEAMYQNYNS